MSSGARLPPKPQFAPSWTESQSSASRAAFPPVCGSCQKLRVECQYAAVCAEQWHPPFRARMKKLGARAKAVLRMTRATDGEGDFRGRTEAYSENSTGPPKKRKKIPVQYWHRREPFFPAKSACKPLGKRTLMDIPAELWDMILAGLCYEDLVFVATAHTALNSLISPRRWELSRAQNHDMPGPEPQIEDGSGMTRDELAWAAWWKGGRCALCRRPAHGAPASFALNLHICSNTTCLSRWRKEVMSDRLTSAEGTSNADRAEQLASNEALLGPLDVISWPSEELRRLVRNGLSPYERVSTSGNKYRVLDLLQAVEEWMLNADKAGRSAIVERWQQEAQRLHARLVICRSLADWRDRYKNHFNYIREVNEDLLRKKAESWGLMWRDAANSPTVLRLRDASRKQCQSLSEGELSVPSLDDLRPTITAESNNLRLQRQRRMAATRSQGRSDLQNSFHGFCTRMMDHWGLSAMPPKAVFKHFPTVKRLPSTYVDLPNWADFVHHILIELRIWNSHAKTEIEHYLGSVHECPDVCMRPDYLNSVEAVFKCQACDDDAEARYTRAREQAQRSRNNSRTEAESLSEAPKYRLSMSWNDALSHDCLGTYDLGRIQVHRPAMELARHACENVGMKSDRCTSSQLLALGKAWECTQCSLHLDWNELYPHAFRHAWDEFGPLLPAAEENMRKPALNKSLCQYVCKRKSHTGLSHRPTPLPDHSSSSSPQEQGQKTVLNVAKMKHAPPAVRNQTKVKCAHCMTAAIHSGGDLRKLRIMTFDGLRSHLIAVHNIRTIQQADIMD